MEPTVDALIGIDGFFRDTMQKTINYAADKVPRGNDIMQSMFPGLWGNIKMQKVFQIDYIPHYEFPHFATLMAFSLILVYHSCSLNSHSRPPRALSRK